jgi:hypothetical protein
MTLKQNPSTVNELIDRGLNTINSPLMFWLSAGLVVLGGFVLRIRQYLEARALTFDEALLANNIINHTFSELTGTLDNDQVAPMGFLFIEKLVIQTFGVGDLILKLFPFASGLCSIILMGVFAYKRLSKGGLILALSLFTFCQTLIHNSNTFKQYSSDVFFCLLFLVIFDWYMEASSSKLRFVFLCLVGLLCIWFSQPVVLVMFTCALIGLSRGFKMNNAQTIRQFISAGTLWLSGFLIIFFISYANNFGNDNLTRYWSGQFLPMPPWQNLSWYGIAAKSLFVNAVGLPYSVTIVSVLFCIGILAFIKERDFPSVNLVLGQILLTLGLSALHLYPFYDRFLLFLVPGLILVISKAFDLIYKLLDKKIPKPLPTAIWLVLAILFLVPIVRSGVDNFVHPPSSEELKSVMLDFQESLQPGDTLYIYYGAKPAFIYYSGRMNIKNPIFWGSIARKEPEKYLAELDLLRGTSRVWFLFSHLYTGAGGINEKTYITDYLDKIGIRMNEYSDSGAFIFLYDLTE